MSRPTVTDQLRHLKQRLLSAPVVLNGLSEVAYHQNCRLMSVLERVGMQVVQDRPNDVYGVMVKGSRIKGYHTIDSDLDLVIVSPEGAQLQGVWECFQTALQQAKLDIKLDGIAQLWDQEIELERFIYSVDNKNCFPNAFIGHTVAAGPSLLLARLAVVKIVRAYHGNYNWAAVQERYADDFLGTPDNDRKKIAERLGTSEASVQAVLTDQVYNQRRRLFGLPAPKVLYKALVAQSKGYAPAVLGKCHMARTYRAVIAELKQGF